nr:S8 family serine peptidase [Actinomycetota bacterium]
VGGRVLASFAGSVAVAVQPAKLRALAGQAGVSSVERTVRAMPQASVTNEGVAASGADAWQSAAPAMGNDGSGINVGIVDAGFGNLAAEITAGNFNNPDGTSVVQYVTTGTGNQDHCVDDTATDHGTAVAEIVHQMAPRATLYLYCVDSNVGFSQAAAQVVANPAGIKIVNSSLGFTAESRGDGYAGANSTELAVRAAREAGVLWIQSAGNSAEDHWEGNLVDADKHGFVDLLNQNEDIDVVALEPQATGNVVLSWDQWPTSNLPITLAVQEFDSHQQAVGATTFVDHTPGQDPTLEIDIANNSSVADDVHQYDIFVVIDSGTPPLHYDLTYGGDVSPSYLSGLDAARASSGSILQPADSPWALAVGAADWRSGHALETFSSRGPTIDGRVKPDLLGYDGVSSNIADVQAMKYDNNGTPIPGSLGFYGTSAAAPHVAGAAALIAATNPQMDASDIEAFLESQTNPPTYESGHGLLNLGPADASQVHGVAGSGYQPLSQPVRIVDTRSGVGGRTGALTAGMQLSVALPASVPADASSVVLNVTGIAAKGTTYLSVFADTFSGSTNLSLSSTDPNAAVAAVVKVNSAHGFKLLNRSANTDAVVDVVGYFAAPTATGVAGYAPVTPTRLLDTRSAVGGHLRKFNPNETYKVSVAPADGSGVVPAGATAAVVNLTALNESGAGYLMAYPNPNSAPSTSSLDYRTVSRSNLAVVALNTDGSFTLQNRTAKTDILVDVVGYLSASAPGRFVTLPAPISVADTRTGKGGRHAAMTANAVLAEDGAGLYGIPYHASALWTGYDAVAAASTGYLIVYAAGSSVPHTSNMDYGTGRTVANAVVANLSQPASGAGQFSTINRTGTTNLTQDVFGYFVNPPPVPN